MDRKGTTGGRWWLALGLVLLFLGGWFWAQASGPQPVPGTPPPEASPPPALSPAPPPPPAPAPEEQQLLEKSAPEKRVGDKEIEARVTRDRGGAQPIRQKEE